MKLPGFHGRAARKAPNTVQDDLEAPPPSRRTKSGIYKIEEFFEEDDRPGLLYPALANWILGLTIVSFVAWSALFLSLPEHPSNSFTFFYLTYGAAKTAREFLLVFMTLMVGLAASVIAVFMINRFNLAKIKFIKDITHRDALKAVLKNLSGFDGRYTKSKHVRLVFEKVERADNGYEAIKVTQTVSLRRRFVRGELILDFVALVRTPKGDQDSVEYDLQSDTVPDDAHSVDVTDIARNFPDRYKEMFPGVVNVTINDRSQHVEPEFVNGQENHRRWRFDTSGLVGDGHVLVTYTYSFYQELSGYAFQEISEPTRGFLYNLDFAGVAGRVHAYRIGNLTARRGGLNVGKNSLPEKKYQLEASTSDWVIPNCTVVFCWYRQPAPAIDPPKPAEDEPTKMSMPWGEPGSLLREALERDLDVDGNCLGLALLDVFEKLGVRPPAIDYQRLSTPSDALDALLCCRALKVELANKTGVMEGWLLRAQAKRLGVARASAKSLDPSQIALCMRSMRQLYALRRAEAHWVVVSSTDDGLEISDRLAERMKAGYAGLDFADAGTVLDQKGATFRISLA